MRFIHKEPPDKFSIIKVPFNTIKRKEIDYTYFFDRIEMANDVVVHASQFLDLFEIYRYEKCEALIPINNESINSAIMALKQPANGPKPLEDNQKLIDVFRKFYNEVYKDLTNGKKLDCTHLSCINHYAVDQIKIAFENNIKRNFINNVRAFVNRMFKAENDEILNKMNGKERTEQKRSLFTN
jgi:hypothetical protein